MRVVALVLPSSLQAFLTKLLTVDLPGLIVLPKRLEINIPPAVTAGGCAGRQRGPASRPGAAVPAQPALPAPVQKG